MTRQVLHVLVLGVDDFSELLAIDDLLVDVHLHLVVEVVELLHVRADDLGDGGAPVWLAGESEE